jgi:hypothetical protein
MWAWRSSSAATTPPADARHTGVACLLARSNALAVVTLRRSFSRGALRCHGGPATD